MNKTIKYISIIAVIALFALSCKTTKQAQSTTKQTKVQVYPIGFYNLENLYYPDTTVSIDHRFDKEFTPKGSNVWTMEKYGKKLANMSFVLNEMAKELGGLAAVGVSEVGSRKVLEDLLATELLKNKNLKIVHYESPDWRGVDVGLLYDPARFHYISSRTYPFPYTKGVEQNITDTTFRTRDVLLVTGNIAGERTSILVNHWPSRRGDKSVVSRELAASVCRHIYDSIMAINPTEHVIVMGDLNDDPVDPSCTVVLNAKKTVAEVKPNGLYNTMWEKYTKGIGSLCYQGKWNLFDQIIISENLLGNDISTLKFRKAEIFNRDFLIQKTGKYKGYPFRTFSGGYFQNGYSDHFPTLIYLTKEVNK
ncbi:MAG: endonuclease/exonuclease/phosphatase family protein [Paludibacteraceae bacterium]